MSVSHFNNSITHLLEAVENNVLILGKGIERATSGTSKLAEEIRYLDEKKHRFAIEGRALSPESLEIVSVRDSIRDLAQQVKDEARVDEFRGNNFLKTQIHKNTYTGVINNCAIEQPWADFGTAASFLSHIRDILVVTATHFQVYAEKLKLFYSNDPTHPDFTLALNLLNNKCFPSILRLDEKAADAVSEIIEQLPALAESAKATYFSLIKLYGNKDYLFHSDRVAELPQLLKEGSFDQSLIHNLLGNVRRYIPQELKPTPMTTIIAPIPLPIEITHSSARRSCCETFLCIMSCGFFKIKIPTPSSTPKYQQLSSP